MTAVMNPPQTGEARIVLPNISWETYGKLLTELADDRAPRLTYDRGKLEIMSPTAEHEQYSHTISLLVEVLAEEMNLEVRCFGSTTFKREDLARGFEPDTCFYIAHEKLMRGKKRVDLAIDPPPDLVIEIDITSPSLDKFAIFAQLGIPEIWRYDGDVMEIFRLVNSAYVKDDASAALSFATADALAGFLKESLHLSHLEWLRRVREWARREKEAK